ncbi:Glucan endo-1,3-beta-glucosidase 13 [Ananas comosus]|uniref:Glucan endo-1,3-beta-glucosidase 13 n=1 Tax=Ananas comosus TaxID=4615 RepID=A0A199VKJ9_ANACO|nr:Glucan endo-1,3-beta-glucosidase 13 [Ananas comosus]
MAAYYPAIQIAAMAVDNEMFASPHSSLIALLVPAMTNVHAALMRLGLDGAMKVSFPIALTALRASYLPSAGAFPNDLAERVMRLMLDLLCHTGSYLMRLEEPKFDAGSAVDEHLDVVPRGLHPIYVDKSRRRYLVSSDLIDHPLFRVLIERSDGGEGMPSAVIIVREVVLLEHLLRMLRNVGVHPSRMMDLLI